MKHHFLLHLLFSLCSFMFVYAFPTVDVPSLGSVRGSVMSSTSGRQFSSFRGIPYAKPPVGQLRFKDPVPADPWGGKILDATKEGPACVQLSMFEGASATKEDCLVLNIYTHNTSSINGLKPVMVWIHGGGFMTGSGNGETDFYGPDFIMDRDVVLVTINYRVGVLGFFTTGDSEAPGNYGLLDQSLALRWVRNHIQHFGGDPKSVTIFGESAGGASVEYHILSPRSKGLFDRAIAQSGSAMCPWAFKHNIGVEHYSKLLAKDLNCPLSPSKDLVNCLREKDPNEFTNFIPTKQELGMFPISMFQPRVDSERQDPFLPDEPKKLLEQKRYQPVPLITGVTQNEGALFVAFLVVFNSLKEIDKDPAKYISYLMESELMEHREDFAEKIISQYFDRNRKYEDQLTELEQIFSDFLFNKWVDLSAHLHSRASDQPTFYYNYAHRGQFSFEKFFGNLTDFDQGVGHAEEVFLMFSNKFFPAISRPGDLKVSKMLLDLWTSFATNGVPQSELIDDGWLPLDPKRETRYLKIEAEKPKMINKPTPFNHRLEFWDRVFSSRTKTEL